MKELLDKSWLRHSIHGNFMNSDPVKMLGGVSLLNFCVSINFLVIFIGIISGQLSYIQNQRPNLCFYPRSHRIQNY
jgi:hypothetical protein